MPYDEGLAHRVREHLEARSIPFEEKKMFGGLAFMVDGHMACGVLEDQLVARLGKEEVAKALDEPHTSPMDFTGRVLSTMVYVDQDGLSSEEALSSWVGRALDHLQGLDGGRG